MGGLEVRYPVMSASEAYQASRNITHLLVKAIKDKEVFVSKNPNDVVRSSKMESNRAKQERAKQKQGQQQQVLVGGRDGNE